LFGHRKGSFTGAINDKKGLFQEADGGTIFLDEVGSMSSMLQSRLLRVLQEREVRRVGDNIAVNVNVRVVAASNEPLEKRIKEGTFREDLFYRLNVIPIHLPSLRERRDDIPLLVSHFLRDKVDPHTGQPIQITRQAIEVFCEHEWPGNVRELENAIERACVLCEKSTIRVSDLPPAFQQYFKEAPSDTIFQVRSGDDSEAVAAFRPGGPTPVGSPNPAAPTGTPTHPLGHLKSYLREQEVAYLNRTLAFTQGDKERAAELLGVSLATLYRKLSGEGDT
jgi:DNA-binding NtrC family response regulator